MILPQSSTGAVLVESPNGRGMILNHRPVQTIIKSWDVAPTIYALAAHTLVAGDYIICRPDGTSVWVAAGADASTAANWFPPPDPSLIPNTGIRSLNFSSGTFQGPFVWIQPTAFKNPAGDPGSYVAQALGTAPANIVAASNYGNTTPLGKMMIGLKAVTNLVATDPVASNCSMVIVLLSVDR